MTGWPTEVSAARSVPLIFAASLSAALESTLPRPTVAIVPDHVTFNNFGYIFWAEMNVLSAKQDVAALPVMLMFDGQSKTADYLSKVFASRERDWVTPEEVGARFVTVLNEEAGYARVVSIFGFATAVATLREMGDAVVLDHESPDERAALIASVPFHEGALRNRETYSAYSRGARHLTPYPETAISDALGLYEFSALLPATSAPITAIFDYTRDELLRDRLAVLIGRNGVGKSQLVQSMIEGLRRHPESQAQTLVKAAVFPAPPVFSRLIVMSSVASDTYPRAIPAWSGLDYEYVSLVPQSEKGERSLLWLLLDSFRDPAEQMFAFRGDKLNRFGLLKLLLRRLGFWDQLCIPLREPLPHTPDIFPVALKVGGQRYIRLAELTGEQRSVRIGVMADQNRAAVVLTDDNEVRQLSSGETAMLRFAVLAVSTIENASFLVLEEPETYLHPNYVSELMSILHDLLEATSSVALTVTHSAYVVREATRQRVNVLKRDEDGQPEFVPTPIQTFGASIDSISQFVFSDGLVSHQFRETLDRWLEANPDMSIDGLKGYATEFNPETMSYLAGILMDRSGTSIEI
jgi:energy-coupling factor transporter ATP-binding protein EcfA2